MLAEQRQDFSGLRRLIEIAHQPARRGRDEFPVTGLAFDDIEIVEATDDLQVPLHRRQAVNLKKFVGIEHPPVEFAALVDIITNQPLFQIRPNHAVGDAIVEQGRKVVLRRRKQGILKIDNSDRAVVDHQIPTMIIAVTQAGAAPVEDRRDPAELFSQ